MNEFYGIHILVLSLFESLMKDSKFIQAFSGEFSITKTTKIKINVIWRFSFPLIREVLHQNDQ